MHMSRRAILIPTSLLIAILALVMVLSVDGQSLGVTRVLAAGDIACDPATSAFNGGNGTSNACHDKHTSDLLLSLASSASGLAAVLPLGDNQYYCGGYDAFTRSYAASWGRLFSITHPVVGNHEYLTAGGSSPSTGCDST